MDPWGNAAAQYNQSLGQLQQINQQGYQAQAQGPASIYDRFLQGYVQAKQMKMQEAQMERENAYKLAQSAHLNAQTGDLFQKRQDAETAAKAQQDYDEAFKNSIDEKGNVDQAKLAGELAKRGQASSLPKAMKEVLVNDETKAKTLKERAASDKAAREHIASLAGIGLQGDPSGAIRNIKGLAESNPELYGKHIGVLAMVDPQNPDAQRLALRTLYGQGIEAKELAPKAEIKEIGGKTSVYNVGNPLLGSVSKSQDLGVTATDAGAKVKQDMANGLLTPQEGALRLRKLDNVPVTQVQVLSGMAKSDEGEQAARMLAKKIRSGMPMDSSARANPFVFARAQQIAANKNDDLSDVVDLARANQEFKQSLTNMQDWEGKGLGRTQITSINTVGQHFNALRNVAAKLNAGDLQAANKIAQSIGLQTGSTPEAMFDNIINFLAPEVDAVLSGGHRTVEGVKSLKDGWKRQFSTNQLGGVIDSTQEMLGGRLNSLNNDFMRTSNGKDLVSSGRVIGPAAENLGKYISKPAASTPPASGGGKTLTRKQQNAGTKQTRFIYSDGTVEVKDGLL